MEVSSLAVVLGVGTGVLFFVQAEWSGHFIAPFCRRTARAASEGRLSEPHGHDRAREQGVREACDPANQGPGDQHRARLEPNAAGHRRQFVAIRPGTMRPSSRPTPKQLLLTTAGQLCGHTIMTEVDYTIPSPLKPPGPSPRGFGTVRRAPRDRSR